MLELNTAIQVIGNKNADITLENQSSRHSLVGDNDNMHI